MNYRYEQGCLADPAFYDTPSAAGGPGYHRPTPEGWDGAELGDWLMYWPRDNALPAQGWKIHASACLDNADDILAAVWDHCVAHRIAFKFLRNEMALIFKNGKAADRSGSGKFATIYPRDVAELEEVLTDLGGRLDGFAGPYILSDLRIGDGPLYVRYGGFALRQCIGPTGGLVPAIADSSGRLVPDERAPTFRVPEWVPIPDFLASHLAARARATVEDLPWSIESALHFSNGGGVYLGTDRATDEKVVLKEARPHAGLALDGADAVARLTRERITLDRLAGLDVVPGVRGSFVVGDHHFLVLDHVEGATLRKLLVERYPLGAGAVEERAPYASWVVDICARVEAAFAAVHGRGIAIGDFNPDNVLVGPDGRVVLIDWEVSIDVGTDGGGTDGGGGRDGDVPPPRATLGTPGFAAPVGTGGADADRYSLACLRLHLFLPLTRLLRFDADKAGALAAEIAELFPVPPGFLAEAVATVDSAWAASARPQPRGLPELRPDRAAWEPIRDSMAAAIVASATPERQDRLFPGDIAQFTPGGGLNLAHGAAGVLYALDAVGIGCLPEHEDWLVARASDPPGGTPRGLYDGLGGVAFVLDTLGWKDVAVATLDRAVDGLDGHWERLGLDLQSGLAGLGLVLEHFADVTGDAGLRGMVAEVCEAVGDRLGGEDSVPEVSGGDGPHAGLLRGSSGPALLMIRTYERTGDAALLDLAATALGQDLRRCVAASDGSLQVNEGYRMMPYIADGSAGIGLVLRRYLNHRPDERFAHAVAAIRIAAQSHFYVQSGLFAGRAGMILGLSDGLPPGAGIDDRSVAAHVRRLAWHAVPWQEHLAFPGDQLLRLSMDLASGAAGVMLALGSAMHENPVHLPFLGIRPPPESW